MKKINILILIIIILFSVFNCKQVQKEKSLESDSDYTFKAPISKKPLPDDIKWLTNDSDPVYASSEATKGGIINFGIMSFPLTFRVVGPDSNTGLRSYILGNQFSLIGMHPNTENITPELASHWAFDEDKKTMYFKLNRDAKWSDEVPLTAHDFAYTLEFMRSKLIVAPWYNDYYTREIEKVIVYDDYTLAVVATKEDPDLFMKIALGPTPRHYYGKLDDNFVMKYNWKIVPNTGAYQITRYEKGKYILFERKKEWWGRNLKYYKDRFNIDKVRLIVIKDENMRWEYFKKNKIDIHGITAPTYWYDKTKSKEFKKGLIKRIWFFNDTQQSQSGLFLNQDIELFKDKNLRYAFAHAMNIEKVIKKVLRNDYYRLEHGYVGYGEYSNNKIKARRYDLDKVDSYMKESGWARGSDGIWKKDGKRYSVNVTYSQDYHTNRLVVLKEEALKAGIELVLDKVDSSSSYKKVMEKKHDVAWMGWSTSLRPRFWEHYHSVNAHKPQTNNVTNTDNKDLDLLIDKYRNSTDQEERKTLAKKLQQMVHDNGNFVPTFMVPYVREAYWRYFKLPNPPGTKTSDTLFSPFDSAGGGLFWYDEKLYNETKNPSKSNQKYDNKIIIDDTYKMDIIK